MRITRVHVVNFKSIEDSGEIDITPLFALIGKNNSGKSALVEALQCLWEPKDLDCRKHQHKANNKPIRICITLSNQTYSAPIKGEKIVIHAIELECLNNDATWKLNGKASNHKEIKPLLPNLLSIPAIRNPEDETTGAAKTYLRTLISGVVDLPKDIPDDIRRWETQKASALDIPGLMSILQKRIQEQIATASERISNHFRNALGSSELALSIDPITDIAKSIGYETNVTDPHLGSSLTKVNILECGTGLQSVAILALLQAYAETEKKGDCILFIEEPEVYLHPELQRKMFQALRQIARQNQIIFTTHSPIMISELWLENSVKLVKRDSGKSVFSQIDIPSVISELGIRYEDVLNTSRVVFVEGNSDVAFFEILVSTLYSPKHLETQIKFIPSGNFQAVQSHALMHILLSDHVSSTLFLIADRDANDQRAESILKLITEQSPKNKSEKLKNLRKRICVLPQHELESYFLSEELIKNILPAEPIKNIRKFLDVYWSVYNEAIKKLRVSKKKAVDSDVVQLYRPSLIFDPQDKYDLLCSHYKDSVFIGVWSNLAKAWNMIPKKDRLLTLLKGIDPRKSPQLKEIVSILDQIIKE